MPGSQSFLADLWRGGGVAGPCAAKLRKTALDRIGMGQGGRCPSGRPPFLGLPWLPSPHPQSLPIKGREAQAERSVFIVSLPLVGRDQGWGWATSTRPWRAFPNRHTIAAPPAASFTPEPNRERTGTESGESNQCRFVRHDILGPGRAGPLGPSRSGRKRLKRLHLGDQRVNFRPFRSNLTGTLHEHF